MICRVSNAGRCLVKDSLSNMKSLDIIRTRGKRNIKHIRTANILSWLHFKLLAKSQSTLFINTAKFLRKELNATGQFSLGCICDPSLVFGVWHHFVRIQSLCVV